MVTRVIPEIDSALDHPDPRQAVERVKNVVQRHLLQIYPQAQITRTEFFNHTYVPDLLMQWTSGKQQSERRVYLRASSDPGRLASDVMLFEREQHPLVLPLSRIPFTRDRERLESIAEERQALILDPDGLGALPTHEATRSATALASRAIVEGGLGVMGENKVERFVSSVVSGVEAAREGVLEPTRDALNAVTQSTVPATSRRMSTFMAAMWQGSGRPLTEFPGEVNLGEALDEASLSLLLYSLEIPDESFWRRISSLVDVKILLAANVRDTQNLQHLMRSVVRDWRGHVCMVVSERGRSQPADSSWRWIVDRGKLGIRGSDFIAYLAASRKELDFPGEYSVPLLEQVRGRASRFSIPVTSIRMLTGNRSIGYDAPGEDVTNDPQLEGISAALGRDVGVGEAQAVTEEGFSLRCNFSNLIASPTGARTQVPYFELLGISLRLFMDLDDESVAQLDRLLNGGTPARGKWAQEGLFDE